MADRRGDPPRAEARTAEPAEPGRNGAETPRRRVRESARVNFTAPRGSAALRSGLFVLKIGFE